MEEIITGFVNIEVTCINCKEVFLSKITLYKYLKTCSYQRFTPIILATLLNILIMESSTSRMGSETDFGFED